MKSTQEQLFVTMKNSIIEADKYIELGDERESGWKEEKHDMQKRQMYYYSLQFNLFDSLFDQILKGKIPSLSEAIAATSINTDIWKKAYRNEMKTIPEISDNDLSEKIVRFKKILPVAEKAAINKDNLIHEVDLEKRTTIRTLIKGNPKRIERPFTKAHVEFFKSFYEKLKDLYESTEGQEVVSTKEPIKISLLGLNKSEYHMFFEALKTARDYMELQPNKNGAEDDIMDFTRAANGNFVVINFKNVKRDILEPNETLQTSVHTIMKAQNKQNCIIL